MQPRSLLNRLTGPAARRHVIRWGVTLVVVGLVLWFAGGTVKKGWQQLSDADLVIHWPWVAVSAVLYLVGLAPQAFFWRMTLARLGEHPPMFAIIRAYYLGHLGKYVPGKALVAVLRTGVLVQTGCNMRRAVVSVFVETLLFMATGGALAAALLVVSGDGPSSYIWLSAGLALLVGVPATPPVARRLARRIIAKQPPASSDSLAAAPATDPVSGITWSLTAAGVLCSTLAWGVLGLSLWAAVRAVSDIPVSPIAQLALWIESVTLPVVAGFLSLIPGGLMVRDVLQVELLTPTLPADVALVVAAAWRLISVASEGTLCAILEASRLYRSTRPTSNDTP
ncbi:lysylphosphatidylglycerol synthase domain-containing protein [Aeoliella sp. SH292]|uniref:lysylphosphatidylglycerol synthase domain-containing protein n=1 Tax=Aeoliella sp. SH292 TaxID=3454464 RepID=UPI003F99B551